MKLHDPYSPILDELRRLNDADTDELFSQSLEQSQLYVTELRKAYGNSPSNVDFSCPNTRAAYLLAYYPYYIEPIYETLGKLPEETIQRVFGCEKVRAVFLGAGPAPEVLGWLAFLQEKAPEVKSATAYLLDKYIHGWRTGQEITRYHLAHHYWPNGQLAVLPKEFDYLAPQTLDEAYVKRALGIADLVVMQNCLNDQLGYREGIMEVLKDIFSRLKTDALFAIADLKYMAVRDFMREMGSCIEAQGIGKVIVPVLDRPTRTCSNIKIPEVIHKHLLTSNEEKFLIPRKNTDYYSIVIQRTELDEIPF